MNEWWPKIMILVLLGLILGVPFALRPAEAELGLTDEQLVENRLIILTPHNEQIRYEMEQGFNAHRVSQGRLPVYFDWRASGGTSDLRKQVIAEFTSAYEDGKPLPEYDLFFGGGDFEHNLLSWGVDIGEGEDQVNKPLTIPINLDPGLIEEVFPQTDIAGVDLYDPDMQWVGIVLSSFGIVYNRDVLAMRQLDEPRTWDDMKHPNYFDAVALSDPAHSGSIAVTYNTIVRRKGWTEGWNAMRRIFANARYFTNSSSKVPVDVSAGEAAAGMCIDFYGRFQAGAIGGDRVGYVDPVHMTATTPDPISILAGTQREALATEFIVWLLSKESQRLWQHEVGSPGGPERYALRRLPIRRDLYTEDEMGYWVDAVNPFDIALPFPEGMPDFYRAIAPLAHAIAIDIHDDLQAAWLAIVNNPNHPRREQMLAAFNAMPPELMPDWPSAELAREAEAIIRDERHPRHADVVAVLQRFEERLTPRLRDKDRQLADRFAWTRFFRQQYREVVAIADRRHGTED